MLIFFETILKLLRLIGKNHIINGFNNSKRTFIQKFC